MNPPRVVIDTNAVLQILGARSPYHFLFQSFLKGAFDLCVSTEILLEYEEILDERASPAAASLFLKVLAYSRNVVHADPYFQFQLVTRDPDDNKFTDCAIVAQADMLVTDDAHFREAAECPFPRRLHRDDAGGIVEPALYARHLAAAPVGRALRASRLETGNIGHWKHWKLATFDKCCQYENVANVQFQSPMPPRHAPPRKALFFA